MKKRCLVNRRGYFFLIDSVIALGVLIVGVFLIFSMYTKVPSKEQSTILSDNVMDFFANNKIKDVNNLYAGLGGELWAKEGQAGGLCPGKKLTQNSENTLLQQLAEFYEKSAGNSCYLALARKFIVNLTKNTLPPQYAFEFWINGQLLYPNTEQVGSKNAAQVLIPSKRIVYGNVNKETGEMFGPYTAEVLVWQ